MSKSDISAVSGVVGEIKQLGERAKKTAAKMKQTIGDADQALSLTDQLADELGGVTAELRAALGLNSNFPPSDLGAPIDIHADPAAPSALGQPAPLPDWVKKPE